MKTLLVFASLFFTAGVAQACVGFSGAYSTFRAVAGKYHVVVLDQDDCKTVAVGSFQLDQQTSVVSDELEPKIFYTDKDNTRKCELSICRVFNTTPKGLEFAEKASIYINGTTCKYDRVAWERVDTWNLKITFRIVDSAPACRQLGRSASVIMKDIKHASFSENYQ